MKVRGIEQGDQGPPWVATYAHHTGVSTHTHTHTHISIYITFTHTIHSHTHTPIHTYKHILVHT